jgi:hypothetical protein
MTKCRRFLAVKLYHRVEVEEEEDADEVAAVQAAHLMVVAARVVAAEAEDALTKEDLLLV